MMFSAMDLQKNIIGVDIDNVLSDTDFVIRSLIAQKHGVESKKEQITRWYYSESLPITLEQELSVLKLFHSTDCLNAPILPFAAEALMLLSAKYSIWLITGRPEETNSLTKQWLERHKITYDRLIHSSNKTDYIGRFQFLIEDNGETAIACAKKNVPVILFHNPWNDKHEHPLIIRVTNWYHALAVIENNQGFQNYKPQPLNKCALQLS